MRRRFRDEPFVIFYYAVHIFQAPRFIAALVQFKIAPICSALLTERDV